MHLEPPIGTQQPHFRRRAIAECPGLELDIQTVALWKVSRYEDQSQETPCPFDFPETCALLADSQIWIMEARHLACQQAPR